LDLDKRLPDDGSSTKHAPNYNDVYQQFSILQKERVLGLPAPLSLAKVGIGLSPDSTLISWVLSTTSFVDISLHFRGHFHGSQRHWHTLGADVLISLRDFKADLGEDGDSYLQRVRDYDLVVKSLQDNPDVVPQSLSGLTNVSALYQW